MVLTLPCSFINSMQLKVHKHQIFIFSVFCSYQILIVPRAGKMRIFEGKMRFGKEFIEIYRIYLAIAFTWAVRQAVGLGGGGV